MFDLMKLAKLAIFLASSQIIDPSTADPDIRDPYDRTVRQICDSNFRPILSTKFSRIDYVGHNIYLGWSINSQDKYQYGKERTIFTGDGKELPVSIPKGTRLIGVFWLGKSVDENPSLQLSDLPQDTILRYITTDHTFGLCDLHGKNILPENFGCIGKASKGKAFISDKGVFISPIKSNRFWIFDCATKSLKKLPLTDVHRTENLSLNDGLAAFDARFNLCKNDIVPRRPEAGSRNESGYINTDGVLSIVGKFKTSGPFHNGIASVALAAPTENGRVDVVIDRTGKIISPPTLEVKQFYGDYAVARYVADKPATFGIVNRKFEFVIPPKYEFLREEISWAESALLDTEAQFYLRPAKFYLAQEHKNLPFNLITVSGNELVLPAQVQFSHLYTDGVIRCMDTKLNREVFFDLNGKEIDNPVHPSTDSEGHRIYYNPIGQHHYLKLVTLDTGRFDPEFWKSDHNALVNRKPQWQRFLDEYDLIGMPRTQMMKLLGPGVGSVPDQYSYALEYHCTGGLFVQVKMNDDKVDCWCITDDGTQKSDWIRTNVVMNPDTQIISPKSK